MNPLGMMELASKYSKFKEQHPKFGQFLKSVANKNLQEGSLCIWNLSLLMARPTRQTSSLQRKI